ncbi:MAG: hypothetical protein COT14_03405 [Candidatus Diapherotrites archaeon CG08_land_8_20_14_0_20_30_16]|nr:MAG: hypothetical protein COT14_03405 [Candidatus Diapherotrites archaeon CG08_land_8_20_14_0_20_30_16]
MNKCLIFVVCTIFLLCFSFALSFPGKAYKFSDLNTPLKLVGSDSCFSLNLSALEKDTLKNTPGILGLLLHLKETENSDDFVFVQSDLGIVYNRNLFGFNINHRHYVSDSQDNYLFIPLESVKKGKIDLYLCGSAKDKIELYSDSEIGTYKIPYFGEDSFSKSFLSENYKINEKIPIQVTLKNAGYGQAEVFLFYDNEIFTKWFKLKNGTPSLTKKLSPNESISLEYNVVPLTGKSFTVSPAIVSYSVNGYVFNEFSNALISNARVYLDEIFVTLNIPNKYMDINQQGNLSLTILNDSDKNKQAVLMIDGLSKFNQDERYELTLKPFETKTLSYKVMSDKELIVTFDVSLFANDKDKTEKQYDSQTIYFGHSVSNYNYLFVIVAIILVAGLVLYYKFGL